MDAVNQSRAFTQPLGESEVFLNFQEQVSRAATVDRSVLIVGERGSGKEIAAMRLHYLSPRWQKPLVTVNCAALPPSLIESELFGYEQGAFTGAQKTRKGRFEEAHEGTLFLDEIGLIPLEVQEKILRVVEYGTFERVGSSKTHELDVRIVGATNADLPLLCRQGKFKEDLLDRLSFEVLFLPPLRERGDDILLLANFFAARMALETKRTDMPVFTDEVQQSLLTYAWPGNVRELKNVVERAVYRSTTSEISHIQFNPFENPFTFHSMLPVEKDSPELPPLSVDEVPDSSQDPGLLSEIPVEVAPMPLASFEEAKREVERSFMERALLEAQGNQRAAANLLDITYDQFRGLYRKYKPAATK